MIKAGVAERWRELSGRNNWQNLLKPLDIDLQQYILHYGAMAQATYDTFNSEKLSKYAGSSRYSRKNLFSRVGLVEANPFKYEAFIVKSSCDEAWCKDSNWMGYVAVATDEGKIVLGRRDILVAWRGTIEQAEWAKDFDFPLVPASEVLGRVSDRARVHRGVLSIYTSRNERSKFNKTSARDQVLSEIQRQVEKYKDEEISITVAGHSLGAALSTLNAADIVCNAFASYTDVGTKLIVDSRNSPFLKYPGDIVTWHNLEVAYLHPLAIENAPSIRRSIALVNKGSNALKDQYLIPDHWWCEKNKGMVQLSNGSWILDDHETDDNDP
ncbi:phospholipase a1-iigamma [Phtheirospermum japonicum]|uniref:Phospholipase A1 n=1 Tax=Phtheirospermum japonicum TaxID=374723 RepID=A0A830B4Q9_9LAMI|nr:phospholipase a1-iigamma [Phtheirospermum japonicum]